MDFVDYMKNNKKYCFPNEKYRKPFKNIGCLRAAKVLTMINYYYEI